MSFDRMNVVFALASYMAVAMVAEGVLAAAQALGAPLFVALPLGALAAAAAAFLLPGLIAVLVCRAGARRLVRELGPRGRERR